jgi:hypothetical protein
MTAPGVLGRYLRAPAGDHAVPGRRGLQICLGLSWLLDAGLQYQPYMFSPFFVTQVIQPSAGGDPSVVAGSVNWAVSVMLAHIAIYNAIFATVQLLIAAGILFRPTVKLALACSIAWSAALWWFGEGLGGILTGGSPLAGLPGGVILYAFIAVLLWPRDRKPVGEQASPAISGLLRARWAYLLWSALWGSFCYYLLLPGNRAPGAIAQIFASTDGQPGWIVAVMNGLSGFASHYASEITAVLTVACALISVGVWIRAALRPALLLAVAAASLIWVAEGFGGILTGEGTDPNTGPLLVLLAACYWPRRPHRGLSSFGRDRHHNSGKSPKTWLVTSGAGWAVPGPSSRSKAPR